MKGLLTLLLLLPALAVAAAVSEADSLVTVAPAPSSAVLLNPGKGWSAGGLPERHPKEVLDLLGMGVLRLDWSSVEPREGQFDWTTLDRFLEAWARLGKVCNIGIMCANTHSRAPEGYVTPRWVFDAGAKKIEIVLDPDRSTTGTPGKKIAPVFDDPVFLAKFAEFLHAFGKRYDGDPRIAVLDIRSYGNWGEAHMYPFGVPDIAPDDFRRHVQMHLDAFEQTRLCLSRNAHLGRFGPLKPVFDWAVLEKRIAPRRDGICGNSDGSETAIGFGIAPGVFELFDSYDGVKQRGWWEGRKDQGGLGFTLEECVENGKPTWVDLGRGGASGLRMVRENRALIERLSNRIGYHFHLQRAVYPGQAPRGNFDLELNWTNQGVAPIYLDCAVAVTLLDEDGQRVATAWPAECRPSEWFPGQPAIEKARLAFSEAPPGEYRLGLALTREPGDGAPYIGLGTDLPMAAGWYVLGRIEIVSPGNGSAQAAGDDSGAGLNEGARIARDRSTRLPPEVLPSLGCWFWTETEFQPEGYRPFLDLVGRHAGFNLLTTSLRVPRREVTESAVHDQIGQAAAYAQRYAMKLVMDLDVRLARQAFQRAYPEELQEMLRLREVPLEEIGDVMLTIPAEVLSDHYTFATTPYVSVASRLVRVYRFRQDDGEETDPASVQDITARCRVIEAATNMLRIAIRCEAADRGCRAVVAAAFAHLTPDVFAPHLMDFQRRVLRQYADLPLAGACKDEWGFPPCFDGCPAKNDFWFSRGYANAYAQRTRGRDLVRDCLLMWRGERGRERERQAAINHYQQLAWQRNAALEDDFYRATKEVFGPAALVATHPTWWPNPDLREFKKNGLHWWAATRDLAQTDEVTPFAVRTALAKKWGGAFWFNMFYASTVPDYERALWSHAMAGGRINYHPLYPTADALGLENTAALLRGDLMRGDLRLRLLHFIARAPIDCPVAVVFGHAAGMNWAGPHYNDVGLDLANELWRQGYPADLIPADEIQAGNLRVDEAGWMRYGSQRYTAAVLYHPEFEPADTADFVLRAMPGRTAIWRVGDWTRDFDARPFSAPWPAGIKTATDAGGCAAQIVEHLRGSGPVPQTPATESIGWDTPSAAPPRAGRCRLVDGTVVWLAGRNQVAGDPIAIQEGVAGNSIEARAVGMLAVRLDAAGHLEALAAGGLSRFKGGGVEVNLDPPVDLALWRDAQGERHGVVQGSEDAVPPALRDLAPHWLMLAVPVPLPLK